MKKAKIVLLISLLIFIGLLLFFIFTTPGNEDSENKPVSLREQYQKEYEEKQADPKG